MGLFFRRLIVGSIGIVIGASVIVLIHMVPLPGWTPTHWWNKFDGKLLTEEEVTETAKEITIKWPANAKKILTHEDAESLKPDTKVKILGILVNNIHERYVCDYIDTNQYLVQLPDSSRVLARLPEAAEAFRTIVDETGDTVDVLSVNKKKDGSFSFKTSDGKTYKRNELNFLYFSLPMYYENNMFAILDTIQFDQEASKADSLYKQEPIAVDSATSNDTVKLGPILRFVKFISEPQRIGNGIQTFYKTIYKAICYYYNVNKTLLSFSLVQSETGFYKAMPYAYPFNGSRGIISPALARGLSGLFDFVLLAIFIYATYKLIPCLLVIIPIFPNWFQKLMGFIIFLILYHVYFICVSGISINIVLFFIGYIPSVIRNKNLIYYNRCKLCHHGFKLDDLGETEHKHTKLSEGWVHRTWREYENMGKRTTYKRNDLGQWKEAYSENLTKSRIVSADFYEENWLATWKHQFFCHHCNQQSEYKYSNKYTIVKAIKNEKKGWWFRDNY